MHSIVCIPKVFSMTLRSPADLAKALWRRGLLYYLFLLPYLAMQNRCFIFPAPEKSHIPHAFVHTWIWKDSNAGSAEQGRSSWSSLLSCLIFSVNLTCYDILIARLLAWTTVTGASDDESVGSFLHIAQHAAWPTHFTLDVFEILWICYVDLCGACVPMTTCVDNVAEWDKVVPFEQSLFW